MSEGSFKDRIKDAVTQHGDRIGEGLDKARDVIDDKTGGKYSDKLDSAVSKAKDGLDRFDDSASSTPEDAHPDDSAAGGDATRGAQQHDPRE